MPLFPFKTPALFTKDYLPVHQTDSSRESEDGEEPLKQAPSNFLHRRNNLKPSLWLLWAQRLLCILVPCLLVSNIYAWAKLRSRVSHEEVFSPAQSAVKYKDVVFAPGITNFSTPYQGWPNEENNRLWEELYNIYVSKIPMSDAARLSNRTIPISQEPGQYIVILSVFHQLHCLNMIRKRVFWKGPENIDEDADMTMGHLDHCIDSIRQSLMCSSDITPLPYVWWTQYDEIFPTTKVKHTCRDFGAIQDWARERQAPRIDTKVQPKDPLGQVTFTPSGKTG